MYDLNKLKNTLKFPTSIIVRGQDLLGIELAKSLLEQGGFVILIDKGSQEVSKYIHLISHYENLVILDYSGLVDLTQELRRLDYVFYLNHQIADLTQKVSTHENLQASNYLDAVLDLTAKFDAKFLLSTSIKAHQQLVSDRVLDFNYNINSQENYTIYSELDIQRYAESLVKEYQEKVGINARIVRIGTLLGKGMEINLQSHLIKLIIQGLQGKNLVMPGDGLESDYYIHYLDAAYGLIKAQFTPNTKGNIYTLANEEEISILSIAYKLLEVLPNAKEIKFDANDHSLPALKLYKPAKNLLVIGWKPRISMERALTQTIDYLKNRLEDVHGSVSELSNEVIPIPEDLNHGPKTFWDKMLGFFFVSETDVDLNEEMLDTSQVNTEGALARLIAERKNQEKARRGNIILANNKLRSTLVKPSKQKNLLQKVDDAVAKFLWGLRKRFDFFKNMTVLDFFFFLTALVGFSLLYFLVIAPAFSLGRNLYFSYTNLETLSQQGLSTDYSKVQELTNDLKENLTGAQLRISDLQFAFILTQQENYYNETQQFLANSIQYCNNLEEILSALQPWNSYASEFNPNFIYRYDNEKFISVDSKVFYTEKVKQIFANRSNLSLSLNAANKIYPELQSGLTMFPETLTKYFKTNLEEVNAGLEQVKFLKAAFEYAPVLLGSDATRNYLVLVQDNYRYTIGGGELVGYFVFQVRNGAIVSVKAQNISKYSSIAPNFNEQALEEIKLVSNAIVDSSNAKIKDAALIQDRELMLSILQGFIEKQENLKFDTSISINMNVIKDLLAEDGIEFKQKNFNSANFIIEVNNMLQATETETVRNDVLLGLSAKILEIQGNNLSNNDFISSLATSIHKNDLTFYSNNNVLNKFLSVAKPVEQHATNKIILGANYDQKNILASKIPALTLAGKVLIKKDGSSVPNVTLTIENIEAMQNTVYCSNFGLRDLTTPNVEKEMVSQVLAFNLDRNCVIFLKTPELKYQVAYSLPSVGGLVDAEHPYQLELISAPGITVNYDLEFQIESGLEGLLPVDAQFSAQEHGYLYRGVLSGNKLFTFNKK